ncbi:hypothetical protein B0T20DRAFT_33966 [Sordaria brevicollis]|uniref:Uncharacterized protein n=1 Tax=Sordaria brevicollis TaxID=83679 RepID=A0AAE0U9D5_SORBR|nr:hypothetical protein B0T20DRAFT_33966 [Sordaria brevicollis]
MNIGVSHVLLIDETNMMQFTLRLPLSLPIPPEPHVKRSRSNNIVTKATETWSTPFATQQTNVRLSDGIVQFIAGKWLFNSPAGAINFETGPDSSSTTLSFSGDRNALPNPKGPKGEEKTLTEPQFGCGPSGSYLSILATRKSGPLYWTNGSLLPRSPILTPVIARPVEVPKIVVHTASAKCDSVIPWLSLEYTATVSVHVPSARRPD